jgi:hypothetical protein
VLWFWLLIAALVLAFLGRDALRSVFTAGPGRATPGRAVPDSLPGLSAAWLLAECGRLAADGASWAQVSAALNPDADAAVDSLLGRIRAAKMGEPPAILKAIEDACRAALRDNDAASAFDALSLAARNSQWTSSAKW